MPELDCCHFSIILFWYHYSQEKKGLIGGYHTCFHGNQLQTEVLFYRNVRFSIPGCNNSHTYDSSLFYQKLHRNIKDRYHWGGQIDYETERKSTARLC